jgi:hypothetical protein
MVSSTFQDFLASAKEVSCEEFYNSSIARENCIDSSWFIKHQPVCFTVLDDEQWFVKFNISDQVTYYTVVEKEERWGSLESLARWVFDWLQEEYGE